VNQVTEQWNVLKVGMEDILLLLTEAIRLIQWKAEDITITSHITIHLHQDLLIPRMITHTGQPILAIHIIEVSFVDK